MASKTITAGDTMPITAVLRDADGVIDLSASTVVLRCEDTSTGTVTELSTTVNDSSGNTSAAMSSLSAGIYNMQWKVTTGGNPVFVPNERYDRLIVQKAI